jgi:CheY-like chemotaxis protein
MCDVSQLENGLLNLAINARDAMSGRGNLTIHTANVLLDDHVASSYELSPGTYVKISVEDTGAGMPPKIIKRAFDPFFTTKKIGEGTGLGLSMIYGFAKQSGGYADIESEVGKGTIVSIYLPRHYSITAQSMLSVSEPCIPMARNGESILLVEDDLTVRLMTSELLTELGYEVFEAVDAKSCLKQLEEHRNIDLLITDMGLPGGLNGFDLAHEIRARLGQTLKVLFITGYAKEFTRDKAVLTEGMHLLRKPFVADELGIRIRSILDDVPL